MSHVTHRTQRQTGISDSNYRNATASHVDDEDKLRTQIRYAGQTIEVTFINESGLFSCNEPDDVVREFGF